MEYLIIVLKLIVGLSILNVWLLRSKNPSRFRGGNAKTIAEEFELYGLPSWFMYVIGAGKVGLAILLLISIYYPGLEHVAVYGISFMMLGAIFMHMKIGDPLMKSFPAFAFLVLSLLIVLL